MQYRKYSAALQKYTLSGKGKGWYPFAMASKTNRKEWKDPMGQTKASRGLESLNRATDILSTLLAQQVRELNSRQRAARREGESDPGTMKGLKEATAVLKDLAAVAKTLNDQGMSEQGTETGVVVLPCVEEEEP